MEGFLLFTYFFVNFLFIIPLVHAADKRDVRPLTASLVTLICTPIIGFLFVISHPLKSDLEFHDELLNRLSEINEKIKKLSGRIIKKRPVILKKSD